MEIPVKNPANGDTIGSVQHGDIHDVDKAVETSWESFSKWKRSDPVDRGKILFSSAMRVREMQTDLALLLTQEQGKPIKESMNEIAGYARILEYYASISGNIRGDYGESRLYGHAIVAREPLGVCAAIIPWNMPAIIMGWKIGPTLASGNTVILKPASSAPLTCIRLANILLNSGLPEGVLQVITGRGEVIGEALAKHREIRALSFTGQDETGIRVASLAAPTLKRLTLELGGSDPMIVCPDADIDEAAKGAVHGRFFNCGQTCTAVKRLLVHDQIAEPLINRIQILIKDLKVGDGQSRSTDIGPVHTSKHRQDIAELVNRTLDKGSAVLAFGGEILTKDTYSKGSFYAPTLLTDVSPDSPVVNTEVFGPVLPVMTYSTLDEAINIANNTKYGLGASIWTHDSRIISTASQDLKAGIIWVNQHLKIPPEVPFGGIKGSGLGRENGRYALENYLEEKVILIRP